MASTDPGDAPRTLVCYGSSEGQTRKIATRMASVLESAGHRVRLVDAAERPIDLDVGAYDGVLVGASIHAGRHQTAVREFVRAHTGVLNRVPSGFVSVSLTAAHEDPAERAPAEELLEGFLEETGWNPDATLTVAGALKYSQYGRFKRFLMRRIAGKAGGDTDTSRDYEYTDWEDVDAFAREFATLLESAAGSTG
ncbi:flavodoxin domain-containing protein [Halopiger goleimassiliensis]|uniref:flavodoxin domain-containing protein n=1 Tax=Halopiger goleimassiliensis TaxID=1293048 RepID=UPI00067804AE|nr:flavodoxin domain-containing protein [Halopiger goleimassiliensis]